MALHRTRLLQPSLTAQYSLTAIIKLCMLILSLTTVLAHAQIPLRATHLSTNSPGCAITQAGGLKCWGPQYATDTSETIYRTAVDMQDLLTGVVSTTNHCALLANGTVKCWGNNGFNQLGTGDGISSVTPITVPNLNNVVAIASGGYHNCGLLNDGRVKCWGSNERGQLGVGTTSSQGNWPLYDFSFVQGISGAIAISAGIFHSCALLNTGGVKCWGDNSYNQLGIGLENNDYTAKEAYGLNSGVTQMSVGGISACAVMNTGSIKCWGYDPLVPDGRFPTNIAGFNEPLLQVSVGYSDKCAITISGALGCWGSHYGGPIIDNAGSNPSLQLASITGLGSDVDEVSVGDYSSCARQGTSVKCWGANNTGQLGNNSDADSDTPVTTLQSFAPRIGIATAGNGQAVVHFSPPTDDSGSPITGYTVTATPAGGTDLYAGSTASYSGVDDLSHLITGLVNGTSYRFSVTATNALGTGLPSAQSNPVIPTGPATSSASTSSLASSSSGFTSSATSSITSTSSARSSASSSSSASLCAAPVAASWGVTYTGSLAAGDCTGGARGSSFYTDSFSFNGTAGQQIAIQLSSGSFDTYLYLRLAGSTLTSNDDGAGGTNSRIPASSGYYTLPSTGVYLIEVTSYASSQTGSYSLLLSQNNTSSSSSSMVASSSSSSSVVSNSATSTSSSTSSSSAPVTSTSSSRLSSSSSSTTSTGSSTSSSSAPITSSSRSSSSGSVTTSSAVSSPATTSSVMSSASSSSSRLPSSSSSSSSSVAAQRASCTYVVSNQWSNGFTAAIRISNTSSSPINGWTVSWQYTDGSLVTSGWNSTMSGTNPYTATNLNWNGTIPPGQTVEFGIQGSKPNGVAASSPTVTGALCR